MPPDTLISVRGVSKKFCRSLKKSLWYGLQDMGRELIGGRQEDTTPQSTVSSLQSPVSPGLRPGEFWAVNNVSFDLKRGECLGLIGRNGAGKTTLLKMLNGLIKPDHGSITMRGRVGALIALGAGFNPILTGRENIYVNGSVLGLTKREIDGKLEEIIDFAEIGDFIDTPVQNYSSGMAVRLGFAVASSLEPDILLVDEVLAVGDASFRAKCFRKLASLMNRGVATIFVSHDLASVQRISQIALWLKAGKVAEYGEMIKVTSAYSIWLDQKGPVQQDIPPNRERNQPRCSGARIVRVEPVNADGTVANKIHTGEELRLRFHYEVYAPLSGKIHLGLSLRTQEEALYNTYVTQRDDVDIEPRQGHSYVDLVFPELCLGAGEFWVSASVVDEMNIGIYDWNWNALRIEIHSPRPILGRFIMPHRWELSHDRDARKVYSR